MVSTLIGYRLYAGNMTKALERIEATGSNKRDADYYAANIGKVHSVDDLLNDYRLYTYAMKAYGLEDQVASKGLMRKVLESDLTDVNSFANKLTDKKYRTFAAAFNFSTNASSESKVAQSTAQETSLVDSYDERRIRQGVVAAQKTNYYQANVNSARSVDEFLDNSAFFDVVVRSIGADPDLVSKDYVRQALMGTLPATPPPTNPKWLTLASKFSFSQMVNGKLLPGQPAQDPTAINQTVYDYNVATDNNTNPAAAAFNTDYYASKVAAGGTMTVDQLLGDKRLFSYIATAFGFDPAVETPAYFREILVAQPGDFVGAYPELMASTTAPASRKEQFTSLRAVFNFDSYGNSTSGGAQTAAQQQTLTDAYFRNYTVVATSKDSKQTSAFKYLMTDINSVTDLLANNGAFGHDALNYALKAFDIDPAETSLYQVRRVLTSDVSDPNSYVNKLKDERFVKLAEAFNFDGDGKAAPQRLVQSTLAQTTTGSKYKATFGDKPTKTQTEVIKSETKAYLTAIQGMSSLDDLMADTKTLNYALKAYGLADKNLSTADIRKILTSDLSNKKSFAYSVEGDAYVKFAQAFNFTTAGTVSRDAGGGQTGAAKLTTANNFLLQALETKASDDGQEGVRLALYFRRNIGDVASMTGILADKAMLKVVMTAFSLPDGFSQIDTSKQVATLEKRLKLADLKDPKKLDRFISRFAALYDVQNADATNSGNPVLQLMGGGSSSSSGFLALF